MLLPLFFLFVISASGILLFFFKKVNPSILNTLIAFGAGSMFAVSLVHILTESLEATEYAIYAFIGGFLSIYIIEEFLTPHIHDKNHGDHTHEDPHEHKDHVGIIAFVAISLHTLCDGLGIRAGFWLSEALGYTILFGVMLHQIPVSITLAAIFRESSFSHRTQILFIFAFAFSAPIGYILSDILLTEFAFTSLITPLITAFAGGSLLYVATADLLPIIHSHTTKKYRTILFFLIWVLLMTSVKFFE